MIKIEWRTLLLQQLSDENIPQLFKWRNSISFVQYLTTRPLSPDIDSFILELKKDFNTDRHQQFIIFKDTHYIGTIYSYSYNSIDKFCFISIYVDDRYTKLGHGIKACLLFCNYLFEKFGLFKIYFDVYEYNTAIINLLNRQNIISEGRFYKQHLKEGKRFDVFRFAIYSEQIKLWIERYR